MMGVADYLYVLNYGKLLAQGTAAEVQANPQVVKAYLGGDE
jgi:branched-chain amino acid transport system ATP-binding protein